MAFHFLDRHFVVNWLFSSFPAMGYEIICPKEMKFNYAFNIFALVGHMHLAWWKRDDFIYRSWLEKKSQLIKKWSQPAALLRKPLTLETKAAVITVRICSTKSIAIWQKIHTLAFQLNLSNQRGWVWHISWKSLCYISHCMCLGYRLHSCGI